MLEGGGPAATSLKFDNDWVESSWFVIHRAWRLVVLTAHVESAVKYLFLGGIIKLRTIKSEAKVKCKI